MTSSLQNITYTYDNIYQLTNVQKPDLSTKAYNFDPVGNRTTVVNGGTETYTSNILNQYTSINTLNLTYDLNGNLTQKTQGTQSTQYTYDYENRLIQVQGTVPEQGLSLRFTYDPFGRRTQKEVNGVLQAKYLYDQDNIILDLDQNNTIIAKYIYGPSIDEPLALIKGNGVYYYSKDGLGSVVNLTDNTGTIVESYTYDEYGNISAPSQIGNRYLYTGREYDPEVGLYYYRARYYDPSIGRFLQTDPIGYYGGINLYTYVGNNPINLVDSMGLSTFWDEFWQGVYRDLLQLFEGSQVGAGTGGKVKIRVGPIKIEASFHAIQGQRITGEDIGDFIEEKIGISFEAFKVKGSLEDVNGQGQFEPSLEIGRLSIKDLTTVEIGGTFPSNPYSGASVNIEVQLNLDEILRSGQ